MHLRANQTTAPPRLRMAIPAVIAFLALCALILGLAAPPAVADTGQQHAVFTTAPPPDLDVGLVTSDIASPQKLSVGSSATIGQSLAGSTLQFKVQPVAELDTSPPGASVVNNSDVTVINANTSSTVVAAGVNGSGTSVANELAIVNERTALGPESALVAANTTIMQTTDAPINNTPDADNVGGQLATATHTDGAGTSPSPTATTS